MYRKKRIWNLLLVKFSPLYRYTILFFNDRLHVLKLHKNLLITFTRFSSIARVRKLWRRTLTRILNISCLNPQQTTLLGSRQIQWSRYRSPCSLSQTQQILHLCPLRLRFREERTNRRHSTGKTRNFVYQSFCFCTPHRRTAGVSRFITTLLRKDSGGTLSASKL